MVSKGFFKINIFVLLTCGKGFQFDDYEMD